MKFQFDEYTDLNTPLHHWDPRCKLISLIVLIFAFSFIRNWFLLPPMLAVCGVLYAFSRLPCSFLLDRLRSPSVFLLAVAILLLFFSGHTVLLQIGPLSIKEEGCLDLILIAVKFFCILTTGIIIFGTTPFLTVVKTMRALGLPFILTDMTLFSYRYLYEIGGNLKVMETAMKLRGFHVRRPGNLSNLASLAGTILIRSYEQADRIFKAMILRGYDGSTQYREEFLVNFRDLAGFFIVLLVATGFIVAEFFLSR